MARPPVMPGCRSIAGPPVRLLAVLLALAVACSGVPFPAADASATAPTLPAGEEGEAATDAVSTKRPHRTTTPPPPDAAAGPSARAAVTAHPRPGHRHTAPPCHICLGTHGPHPRC